MALWISLFGVTIQTQQNVTTVYEDVIHAVHREFGSQCKTALAIFMSESRLRPGIEGDGGTSIGVAQIHIPAHSAKIPVADKEEWLKNFQNNLALAKKIYDKSGWYPWSCYKNGSYLNNLAEAERLCGQYKN